MKYFGTITGLSGAETPGALLPAAEERPGPDYLGLGLLPAAEERPNYLGLGLLCLAGVVICAGIAYMVGRKRGR
jgi:hypothetical protein